MTDISPENQLFNLTKQWYKLIGKDQHKDRDCHWAIEEVWSYGHKGKWWWEHGGYLLDVHYKGPFDSRELCVQDLIKFLEQVIKAQETRYDENGYFVD